jgi:hypothetical protein
MASSDIGSTVIHIESEVPVLVKAGKMRRRRVTVGTGTRLW